MKGLKCRLIFIIFFFVGIAIYSCTTTIQREVFNNPSIVNKLNTSNTSFIKAHIKDGNVYVFDMWKLNSKNDTLIGRGKLLDINRQFINHGSFYIPTKEIVLIESNDINSWRPIKNLLIPLVPTALLAIYCALNPKACFGSCPTFYAFNGEKDIIQSEGFSGSIAPSLEANDIDALYRIKNNSNELKLKLTNEALETHVIRKADILAVKMPVRGRIGVTPKGEFIEILSSKEPSMCIANEGDCTSLIKYFDGKELFSASDSSDLTSKEVIELTFDNHSGKDLGLVLAYRQTLMTTYIFYQILAYMGKSAVDWLVKFELNQDNIRSNVFGYENLLGGIEVTVLNKKGEWINAGELKEIGPIASDVQLIKLPQIDLSIPVKIRLRMTRGYWRIDYASLSILGKSVQPTRYKPDYITHEGEIDDDALINLLDTSKTLITYPGDEYYLHYKLSENSSDYELFLESKGYYLEWMREEWFKEENPALLYQAIFDSRNFLKNIAPEFKKAEPLMEETFWRSRYVK